MQVLARVILGYLLIGLGVALAVCAVLWWKYGSRSLRLAFDFRDRSDIRSAKDLLLMAAAAAIAGILWMPALLWWGYGKAGGLRVARRARDATPESET